MLSLYIFYLITVSIGITFGYHRYFSHREFNVNPTIECVMLYCGLLCGGRSALTWVGVHRMHHAYSDTEKDPHSPKYHPWYDIIFSRWKVKKIPRRFVMDLLDNPRVMFFHRYRKVIYFSSLILTGIIPVLFLTVMSYIGFGILNYFGHSKTGPINNVFINMIAPFEGNHRDHHAKKKN